MIKTIYEIIESGESVRNFRDALIEASRNFPVSSLSGMVYNFYRAVHEYYQDLLEYQFQLYSDRPDYMFKLTGISVIYGVNKKEEFKVTNPTGISLSELKALNDVPFGEMVELQFRFDLIPSLLYLIPEITGNVNKDLFSKDREFSVPKGDGTYYTATFKPTWDESGVILTTNGVVTDASPLLYPVGGFYGV